MVGMAAGKRGGARDKRDKRGEREKEGGLSLLLKIIT